MNLLAQQRKKAIHEICVCNSADSDLSSIRGQFSLGIDSKWNCCILSSNPENSITKNDIIQHNKSSVSSKSMKACWHKEWVKLMGPYGEKECVNKPPCLPSREVCGSVFDYKSISHSLNPSMQWHADEMNGDEQNKVFYEGRSSM